MKKQLHDLGYREKHVKEMTAQEAHIYIKNQIKRKIVIKEKKEKEQPEYGTIIMGEPDNINKKE